MCKIAVTSLYTWTMHINEKRSCHLMLCPFATRWHTCSTSMKPVEANIQRKMLGCCTLLSRAILPTCLVLTLHGHLGNYLFLTGESYSLTDQHIHKTLYRAMFATYQQVEYWLKLRTGSCMESWCWSVEVIYVQKWCLTAIETLSQSPACRMDTRQIPATNTANTAAP